MVRSAPMSVERFGQSVSLRGDTLLLFVTRFTRLFAYGSLSVVLVLYLTGLGLRESQVGLLLTLTLLGDTAVSLALATQADRIGRRRVLLIGAVLMAAAGVAFACTRNFLFLVLAGTVGIISPSGHEVGPFLPIEQAALAHIVAPRQRTSFFAWYSLVGSLATATGSLAAGFLTQALEHAAWQPVAGERAVVFGYAGLGGLLGLLFLWLSPAIEVSNKQEDMSSRTLLGIGPSRAVVLRLSGLFALDAFGGAFVVQSFAAYWFFLRFGVRPATLGGSKRTSAPCARAAAATSAESVATSTPATTSEARSVWST